MKRKLDFLSILLNPYLISIFLTIGILFSLPEYFSKYQLVEINEYFNNIPDSNVFYEDLDNDGLSEKIILQENNFKNASYMLFNSNSDFIDQFNLDTKFSRIKYAWFQDTNQNKIKEIHLLTQSSDSIFLTIQEHISLKNVTTKKVFIDTISGFQGKYRFSGYTTRISRFVNDERVSNVFCIMVGFGGNPRNVYVYDRQRNTVLKSPHLTNPSSINDVFDIDQDGKKEYLLNATAASNDIDSVYTQRSDYSTWINVLDDDLQFLFKPIELKANGSVYQIPIRKEDQYELMVLFNSQKENTLPSRLLRVSLEGKILQKKILPPSKYQGIYKINNQLFAAYDLKNQNFIVFNNKLEEQRKVHLGYVTNWMFQIDIDKDGSKEWVFYDNAVKELAIFDSEFMHPVIQKIDKAGKLLKTIGVRYAKNNDSQIYIQIDGKVFIYAYRLNSYYALRFLVYLVIYGAVLGIVFLILKGQQIREEKQRAIETEIADLQLKTIKNKVDPHFVFNAMNTIGEMTLTDNKLEADDFICRFSDFMRMTLAHSDKISTSLKEEVSYTENFIKLQQIRFKNSFNYSIYIDKKIDRKTKVPKHSLFTYTENAIKHGLGSVENGLLSIHISQLKNSILITIQDNGVGMRKSTEKKANGTGNGLKIMRKIFDLYEDRYKTKIKHQVEELFEDKKSAGVKVSIHVTTKTEKKNA